MKKCEFLMAWNGKMRICGKEATHQRGETPLCKKHADYAQNVLKKPIPIIEKTGAGV